MMDVYEIDAASNRGIENMRELKEMAFFAPAQAKYKVFIIDEVHMLTTEAFNALLKILEEPPEHILFILATTDPDKVPLTVLSRTQRFDFKRMAKKHKKSIVPSMPHDRLFQASYSVVIRYYFAAFFSFR